jgi:hypothetical protein
MTGSGKVGEIQEGAAGDAVHDIAFARRRIGLDAAGMRVELRRRHHHVQLVFQREP